MKVATLAAVVALTLAPFGASLAQTPAPSTPATPAGVQIDSKSLIGSAVRNRDGKDVGKVANLIIDPSEGRVSGVVLSIGGLAGIGAREITVPWSTVQVARDRQDLVLTLQQDPLQPAPARADEKKGSEGQASPSDQKKQ